MSEFTVYITMYGEVPTTSALFLRAMRLQRKFKRNKSAYLDGWMKMHFIAGTLDGHPELQARH